MIIKHNTPDGYTITETWYADDQKFIEVKTYDRNDELVDHQITLATR